MKTLDDAVDFASGLATGLKQYFELVMGMPDREQTLPAYMGKRTRTGVYVQPDLLKRERRAEPSPSSERRGREAEGERGLGEGEQASPTTVAAEAQDVGEGILYGERGRETERRVAWAEERRELADRREGRVLVLAPPGQGKSLLAQMTAQEVAQQSLESLTSQQSGVGGLPLPIVLTLNDLAKRGIRAGEKPDQALRESLTAALREMGCAEVVADYLGEHAHEDRCWLFLDALDEVNESNRRTLAGLFEALEEWQCRVIITSRPYGYEGWRLPFDVMEYRLAPFSFEQQQEFVEKWFEEGEDRDRMTGLLAESLAVQQMAQNPFLLTLLCWVVKRRHLSPEITRTQLYDRVVRDMLGLRPDGAGPVDEQRAEEWLPLLAEMALRFFQENAGRGPMSSGEVLTLFAGSGQRPALLGRTLEQTESLTSRQQAHYLLEELRRKRLLVPLTPDRAACVLPHRSILEYLTACALANQESEALSRLVDRKAWHPDWEQVIIFLAGRLAGSDDSLLSRFSLRDLLARLADKERDDVFRHRLALAALCLPEIPAETRDSHSRIIDHITAAALSIWYEYSVEAGYEHIIWGASEWVPHLRRALGAIGQVNARNFGTRLIEWLLQGLRDKTPEVRVGAVEAVGSIGSAVAAPAFVDRLAQLLSDEDRHVREAALYAVSRIGRSAATPGILDRLAQLLGGEDGGVREAALGAVGGIGSSAATRDILVRLAQLLGDEHEVVRWAAKGAAWGIASAAATPEFLDRLAQLLGHDDRDVREAAVWTVSCIGGAAATPEFLDRLAQLLGSEDGNVRRAAADAVRRIGSAAARPDILDRLAQLLGDDDWWVRWEAAHAVRSIGNAAARPDILDRLAELLRHDIWHWEWPNVWAVVVLGGAAAVAGFVDRLAELLRGENDARWGIGSAAATPEFLDRLAQLLGGRDSKMRTAAVDAVNCIGSAAGRPEFLDCLAQLLGAGDRDVQEHAVFAVGGIGSAAARPGILDRLAQLLGSEDAEVQEAAVWAVESIGGAAATPEFLDRLAQLLGSEDGYVRQAAVRAVEGIGSAAGAPEFLDRLAQLLGSEDADVRRAAADAVGGIGSAAGRPDVLDRLAQLLGDEDRDVREAASRAVGGIGRSAATPDILARVTQLLGGEHGMYARGALTLLMAQGVRIFKSPTGKWAARTVAELSC